MGTIMRCQFEFICCFWALWSFDFELTLPNLRICRWCSNWNTTTSCTFSFLLCSHPNSYTDHFFPMISVLHIQQHQLIKFSSHFLYLETSTSKPALFYFSTHSIQMNLIVFLWILLLNISARLCKPLDCSL